jgi:hypothetical protein
MKFNELEFVDKLMGRQARVTFPNGYGASIVQGPYSYGNEFGLYELAVLKDGVLCYDTPITSDVIGHLSPDAVTELLQQIERLPTVKVMG